MPTNPTSPSSSPAVDRLALGTDSPRGTQPSLHLSPCACFEASTSAVIFGCYGSACFEAEASYNGGTAPLCSCFEGESSGITNLCSLWSCFTEEA